MHALSISASSGRKVQLSIAAWQALTREEEEVGIRASEEGFPLPRYSISLLTPATQVLTG